MKPLSELAKHKLAMAIVLIGCFVIVAGPVLYLATEGKMSVLEASVGSGVWALMLAVATPVWWRRSMARVDRDRGKEAE